MLFFTYTSHTTAPRCCCSSRQYNPLLSYITHHAVFVCVFSLLRFHSAPDDQQDHRDDIKEDDEGIMQTIIGLANIKKTTLKNIKQARGMARGGEGKGEADGTPTRYRNS